MSLALANKNIRFWPKGAVGRASQNGQNRVFLFALACAWYSETYVLDTLPHDFFFFQGGQPCLPAHRELRGPLPGLRGAVCYLFLYPLPKRQVSKILAKPQ
jgi:hypothetical protein